MRAIITVALGALLWATPAGADESCRTVEEMRAMFAEKAPQIEVTVLAENDNATIRQESTKASAMAMDSEDKFVIVAPPGTPNVLVVWFQGGCFNSYKEVSRVYLERLLAGQGAQR